MKEKSGKVSIIIPTYNREKTLERAVNSILNQTYSNIEVIIVDDCSIDNTQKMVMSWKNEKIKYYRLPKNSGACAARNYGIQMASGEYIAFQDSDDEWMKEKIEKQLEKMKQTDTMVTFCAFNFININSQEKIKIPDTDISNLPDMTKSLFYKNFISTQTIVGKKEVFNRIKFDTTLPRFQDWDLAIRLSKEYRISYLDEILVNLYIQKDSMTVNNQKGYDGLKILYNKYKEDIKKDENIEYAFKIQMAKFLFNKGKYCPEELKEVLQKKFNMKIFIYYISCITKTNKLLLKIKKR